MKFIDFMHSKEFKNIVLSAIRKSKKNKTWKKTDKGCMVDVGRIDRMDAGFYIPERFYKEVKK